MGILTWIIVGGLAGWVASMIMKTDAQQGVLTNIIVGIIGALIGGWLMSVLGGGSDIMSFSIESFLVALLGSVVLIGALKLIRR